MSQAFRRRVGLFDHLSANRGGGQLVVARIASQLSIDHDVDLIHDGTGYTAQSLGEAFGLDLTQVRDRTLKDIPRSFEMPGELGVSDYLFSGPAFDRALTAPYDLFLYSGHSLPPVCHARRGIVYQHFPMEGHPFDPGATPKYWEQLNGLDRRIRAAAYQWIWDKRMRSYQRIFVNSQFTAAELQRRWRLTPTILYPPVALDPVTRVKQNVIVSVGRFDGRDGKNIRAQVEAFPRFLAEAPGDWAFCAMGFCGRGPEDIAQVKSLRDQTAGLPMTFLANAERSVMVERLCEAKLFWHTRGLGRPGVALEPRHQEHFGIATVEAMMAGCVPLVAKAGGQTEIVENGVSGVLCSDMDAMVAQSVELARDEVSRARMAERARERGKAFHASVFDRAIGDTVRGLLNTG